MIFDLIDQYWMEFLAVVSAIVYLLLAVRQDIRCWLAAILSSFLYFFIMFSAGLYMEAGLQIFYILMAVYGWSQWREESKTNIKFSVKTWKPIKHLFVISLIFLLALASGLILEKFTNAVFPFIDALTTWGAIVATYMVAKKLLENWIYWFVIDSISIFLFMSRGLVLTSILFFIYLIIIYFGYKSWARIKDNESIKPI
ncbi:nicotinamide riboside transporter PnuC [Gammaproteobacteria bacterium]|jgi:nicotinamide mononucleotide transporter|nr:nicotinamide riboside transporter PnuC [Gammaproteobacteria bacterium]